MFTLKLYVMGLIGLVQIGDGFIFVLPTASPDMPHVPIVVCGRDTDCSASPQNEWLTIQPLLNVEEVTPKPVALLLDGESLQLTGATSGVLELPPPEGFGLLAPFRGTCPDDREEARSLSWLPELDRIAPQAAAIDPTHLFQPTVAEVKAVMPLFVRGELRAFRFPFLVESRDEDRSNGFIHSLTFKRRDQARVVMTQRHASPDVLEVVVQVSEAPARIHLRPFVGAGAGRTLTIQPLPQGREATVLLGNLTPLPDVQLPQEIGSPLHHFSLYYRLSRGRPATAPLKEPHIGKHRVREGLVNPSSLPDVLRVVSTPRRRQTLPASRGIQTTSLRSGVERPICTFAVYILP